MAHHGPDGPWPHYPIEPDQTPELSGASVGSTVGAVGGLLVGRGVFYRQVHGVPQGVFWLIFFVNACIGVQLCIV